MKSQIADRHTHAVPSAVNQSLAINSALRKALRVMAVISLFVFALNLAAPKAQANLISNGGFESTSSPAPGSFLTVQPTGWQCTNSVVCNEAGEVFSPGTADGMPCLLNYCVYGPFPATSPAGGNFLGVDACYNQGSGACRAGYVTIYQNVSGLKPGGTYSLTFYQAAGQWRGYSGPTNDQWEVALGNICIVNCGSGFVGDIQYSQVMNDASHGVVPWEQVTLNFTLPSDVGPDGVLSFVPRSDVSVPPIVFLDGIDLEETPEPTTLLTFGSSLIGLSAVGLRRHLTRSKVASVSNDTGIAS